MIDATTPLKRERDLSNQNSTTGSASAVINRMFATHFPLGPELDDA